MLKPRDKVIAAINRRLESVSSENTKAFQTHAEEVLKEEYNIPLGLSSDYVSRNASFNEASDFILFAVMDAVGEIKIHDYFSDKEYSKYKKQKFEYKKIKFPLVFNAIQIAEDQWISSISAKQLMEFRNCQIISYNENTQRTMTRSTSGGIEHYKITLNRKAVEGIKKSYLNNAYIPNTLTFNIPEDTEFDYDASAELLNITSLSHFDILDGYHRYIALSEISNTNPKFDYSMELRLVTFSEEKARQFIWQEDQKTKMSRIDSATFNQYKTSNVIVQRLNGGALKGAASTNEGKVDSAILANALDYTFAANSDDLTRSQQIRLAKDVNDSFEILVENTPEVLDSKWDRLATICIVFGLYKGCFDFDKIMHLYDKSKGNVGSRLGQKDINRLEEIWERMG